jgi:hypothetical protein
MCASIAASRTLSIGAAGSVMGAAAWINPPRTVRGIESLSRLLAKSRHEDHEGHEEHEEQILIKNTKAYLEKHFFMIFMLLHVLHVCLALLPMRAICPH